MTKLQEIRSAFKSVQGVGAQDVQYLFDEIDRLNDRLKMQAIQQKEIVICAAVKSNCGKIFRGHRHGDCFRTIKDANQEPSHGADAQGFITSRNRFVDRKEGMELQKASGIPSAAEFDGGYRGTTLFSEDLY